MPTYQIGQIRYSGSGCVKTLNATAGYQNVSMSGGTTEGSSYQDVLITPATAFIKDNDYYFSVSIPQDMNYDMEFDVKLIKSENNVDTVYQYLKKISISRGSSGGSNVYTVALYQQNSTDPEDTDAPVSVAIPIKYTYGAQTTQNNLLYYDESKNAYYLGNGSTKPPQTFCFNDLSVIASWREETGINYGVFEMVFRPVEDNFTGILLQMVRTPADINIQHKDGSYGRKIDKDNLKYTLYSLMNQVDNINRDQTLSRIGIWSHPGLLMAINGEEIRVGPSGFYELDDVIDIESVAIVAPDNSWKDSWTMDYEYRLIEEESITE